MFYESLSTHGKTQVNTTMATGFIVVLKTIGYEPVMRKQMLACSELIANLQSDECFAKDTKC